MAYSITSILESPKNLNTKSAYFTDQSSKNPSTNNEINNLLSTRIQGVTLN